MRYCACLLHYVKDRGMDSVFFSYWKYFAKAVCVSVRTRMHWPPVLLHAVDIVDVSC